MAEHIVFTPGNLVIEIPQNGKIEETVRSNTTLKLTNTNLTNKVIFRSKLNAKDTYAIKPTCGIILPNKSLDIDVLFYKKNPILDELNSKKHAIKFEIMILNEDPNEKDPKKAYEELFNLKQNHDQTKMIHIKLIPRKPVVETKNASITPTPLADSQKKEQEKAEAQLNARKAHLGDTNIQHDQIKNAQHNADASKTNNNNQAFVNLNKAQNSVSITIGIVICFVALMIGYFLTK